MPEPRRGEIMYISCAGSILLLSLALLHALPTDVVGGGIGVGFAVMLSSNFSIPFIIKS